MSRVQLVRNVKQSPLHAAYVVAVSGVEWQPVHCAGYLCVMEDRIEFLSIDATVVLSLLKSDIRAVVRGET